MRRFDKQAPPETNLARRAEWMRRWEVSEPLWQDGTSDERKGVHDEAREVFNRQNEEARDSLCREQGELCAFCMGRIKRRDPCFDPSGTVRAHVVPITIDPGRALDWANIVGSCPGGTEAEPHCDKSQRDAPIYFSPAGAPVPFDEWFDYRKDGKLLYVGPDWPSATREEVTRDVEKVLRLNCKRLKENRRTVLERIRQHLGPGEGYWSVSRIRQELEYWKAVGPEGHRPYFPVAVQYLSKKLRQAEGSH